MNEYQKIHLVQKISQYFGDNLLGKKMAIWGLAFKPNTDDIREAPSLEIIKSLISKGVIISVYDPEAMPNVKKEIGDIVNYASNQYDALSAADCLIIATEWSEFRTPDFDIISKQLKEKIIFDGRNLFEIEQMSKLGFYYESIGRK